MTSMMPPPPPPTTPPPPPAAHPPEGDGSGLIPYRNIPALLGYYLGVFSLLPFIGALLGPAAVVLGVLGLRKVARQRQCRGTAHAVVAIVTGLLFGVGQLIAGAVLVLFYMDATR